MKAVRKYSEKNMKDELKRYLDAFSNLYGIISLEKAWEIIHKTCETQITKKFFDKYIEDIRWFRVRGAYYITCYKMALIDVGFNDNEMNDEEDYDERIMKTVPREQWDLVHECYDTEDYLALLEEQDECDYYVPKREELLKYADEDYFEENDTTRKLQDFLRKKITKNEDAIKELMSTSVIIARFFDGTAEQALDGFGIYEEKFFSNRELYMEYWSLFIKLQFEIRGACKRGHTLDEMLQEELKRFRKFINDFNDEEKLFYKYILAMVHLYGSIDVAKASEIISMQNPKIKKDNFFNFVEKCAIFGDCRYFNIINDTDDNDIAKFELEDAWIDDKDSHDMKQKHKNKDYYIPDKTELLKYAVEDYYEHCVGMDELREFIKKSCKKLDKDSQNELFDIMLVNAACFDRDENDALEEFATEKCELKGSKKIFEFCKIYNLLKQNIRSQRNRGFSDADIQKSP